jgi:hypothetical protein
VRGEDEFFKVVVDCRVINEIVANENVGIFLMLVMLCAVEQFYIQFKLQMALLRTRTDLMIEFLEDGQSSIQ